MPGNSSRHEIVPIRSFRRRLHDTVRCVASCNGVKDAYTANEFNAHMTSQGILRCVITLGNTPNNQQHLFIFHEEDGDRMYMIMRFQQQLQGTLILHKQAAKLKQALPEVNFDEMMTTLVNAQEHKLGNKNSLCSLVVGHDFDSSYLIVCV